MVTLWDDSVSSFQKLMSKTSVFSNKVCVSSKVLRVSPLQKSDWNGKMITPMVVVHSVSPLPNRRGTKILTPTSPTSPYLQERVSVPPSAPLCLDRFHARRKELVAPFRATVKGIIADVQALDVSQTGNPKRQFDIVDNMGAWFSCCAVGPLSQSKALHDGVEAVLYHGMGR